MRISEVIGTVTLSRAHPLLTGAAWRICVPLRRQDLMGPAADREEPFVTYDEFGAGLGARIAVSEGAEATAPFHPHQKPIDAYNAAILDAITVND